MYQHIDMEMGRQSFAPKKTVIGWDALLEIPRTHLDHVAQIKWTRRSLIKKQFTQFDRASNVDKKWWKSYDDLMRPYTSK